MDDIDLSEIVKAIENLKLEYSTLITSTVSKVVPQCLVPYFDKGDERPPDEKDFREFSAQKEEKVFHIKLILDYLERTHGENAMNSEISLRDVICTNEILVHLFLLCGENERIYPWNTEDTVKYCQSIIDLICKLNDGKDLKHIMFSFGLIKQLLDLLKPKLMSDQWVYYPAAVRCYCWLLKMLEQPFLCNFLNQVLPTALLLVDHFDNTNRILGITSIHHIVNNLTASELKFHGHGEVMLKALQPLLHSREAEIATVLLPTLVELISKLETDLGDKVGNKWCHWDDLLEVTLQNMEQEHRVALRDTYILHLRTLIDSAGVYILRWSKRLLRIFNEYLQVSLNHADYKTSVVCLEALESYLVISKPIVHLYIDTILFMLFKLLYTLFSNELVGSETSDATLRCLKKVLSELPKDEQQLLKAQINEKLTSREQCKQFVNFLNKSI